MASIRSVGTQVASANNVAASTPLALGLPGTRVNGDLLLLFTSCRTNTPAAPATPAGWTLIANISGTNGRIVVFGRIVDGTESAPTVTWTGLSTGTTSVTPVQGQIACVEGLDTSGTVTNAVHVTGAAGNQAASTTAASGGAAITTSIANAAVFVFSTRQDDAGTWATLAVSDGVTWGKVAATFVSTSGADTAQEWQWGNKATAGAVAAKTFTLSGGSSFASSGVMIAFKPAPVPTTTPAARVSVGTGAAPAERTDHKLVLRARKTSGTTVELNAALYEPVTGTYAKEITAGTSFATAISGVSSGGIIGLAAGTYAWGEFSVPAGVTIQGKEPGVLITGEAQLFAAGGKLKNVWIRSDLSTRKSVVEIDASSCEIRNCDLDANALLAGTAPNPSVVYLGGPGNVVTDTKIIGNKIHGIPGVNTGAHGMYVGGSGNGTEIAYNWIYDYPGYGLHFNEDLTSDAVAHHNVIAFSNARGSVVFATDGVGGPVGQTVRDNALVASGGGGVGSLHYTTGTGNKVLHNLMTVASSTTGAGSIIEAGTLVGAITLKDAAARDLRVPADPRFGFVPGPDRNRSGNLEAGALTTSLADYTLAIPDGAAETIESYADLELRIWGDSPAADVGALVVVAEARLETPGTSGPVVPTFTNMSAAATSGATLAITAPTRVPLAAAAATSGSTLALRAPTGVPLAAAAATSGASLALVIPVQLRRAYSEAVLATAGLVSYWRLGEPSGSALDSKGTAHGTTVAGGLTRAVTGLLANDADKAIQGDGVTGSHVQVPAAGLDVGAQLTVECWLKPTALTASMKLLARSSASTNWFLEIAAAPFTYRWYVRDANLVDTSLQTNNPRVAVVGTTHHLVAVYDAAGRIELYINGVAVPDPPNRTPNANTRSGTGQTLNMFAESASAVAFNGVLDEVALYNVALTPAQIREHYQAGVSAGLIASAFSSATLSLTAAPKFTLATAASSGASLALTAPTQVPLAAAPATSSASLALSAATAVPLAAAAATSDATLAVTSIAQALLPLGPAVASLGATLALSAPTQVPLAAAAATSSAALTITAPTRVPLAAAAAVSGSSLAISARTTIPLAAAPATSGASLTLTSRTFVPLAPAVATSGATLALSSTAVPILPLGTAAASSTASLAISVPTTVPLGAAVAASSAALAITVPTRVPLGTAVAVSTASLTLRAATVVPLAVAAAVSSSSLALTGVPKFTLSAAATSSASLALSAATVVPLAPASAVSGATLSWPLGAYPAEVLADSPRYYWRMGDLPPPLAPAAGSVDLDVGASSAPDPVAGAIVADDGAAQFDGASDGVRALDVDFTDTGALTAEMWLWWDSYANNDDLALEFGTGSGQEGFFINPNSSASGAFGVAMHPGAVGGFHEVGFPRPSAGAWHHIVAVMDKSLTPALSAIRLYVDGVEQTGTGVGASNKVGEEWGSFAPRNLYVMSRSGSSLIAAGRVDELALYPFALTAERILAHYEAAAGEPAPALTLSTAAASAATLALSAQTRVPLGAAAATSSASLALSARALLPLGAASAVSSASLALSARTTLPLSPAAATSGAALNISGKPEFVLAAAAASSASLALTARTTVPLASAAAVSSSALALRAPTRVPLAAAAAASSASLTLTAPTRVPLNAAASTSSSSLLLSARTTVLLAAASATSSAVLALSIPVFVPLAPAAASSGASLDLRTAVSLPLASASGSSDAALSLITRPVLALALAAASSNASLALSARTAVALQAATAQSSASLALAVPTLVALSPSSSTSSATLKLAAAAQLELTTHAQSGASLTFKVPVTLTLSTEAQSDASLQLSYAVPLVLTADATSDATLRLSISLPIDLWPVAGPAPHVGKHGQAIAASAARPTGKEGSAVAAPVARGPTRWPNSL